MPVIRGFVEALEVGRAGLVTVIVMIEDGTTRNFTLADLDADPERFNERLSKLGLLRDALDRAEPIEIEFGDGDNDNTSIHRVRRLTRDALARPKSLSQTQGSIIGLALNLDNRTAPRAEIGDLASVILFVLGGGIERFYIPMQTPERDAAVVMVDLIRHAQMQGRGVTIVYDTQTRHIATLDITSNSRGGDDRTPQTVSGYVESLEPTAFGDLVVAELTTAPAFDTDSNTVPMTPFDPQSYLIVLTHGSVDYALAEAALRDKLRLEVTGDLFDERQPDDNDSTPDDVGRGDVGVAAPAEPAAMIETMARARFSTRQPVSELATTTVLLVWQVKLDAPLSSAARPVWIEIDRRALDVSPDASCVEGLPSNDLRPLTLREVNLPYKAQWDGLACFNHGVYRFEMQIDTPFELKIDGEAVCVHQDQESGVWFAHACLDGDHTVCLTFEEWRCGSEFDMDVYRIR